LKFPIEISPVETVALLLFRQVLNPQQTARVLLIVFMCASCWLWGLWIGHGDIDLVFPNCHYALFGHLKALEYLVTRFDYNVQAIPSTQHPL
jgi:hypothetical protein